MAVRLKEELIKLLKSLEANAPTRKALTALCDQLARKDVIIGSSQHDKEDACLFIAKVFHEHPSLWTTANENRLLEEFPLHIELIKSSDNQLRRTGNRRKS